MQGSEVYGEVRFPSEWFEVDCLSKKVLSLRVDNIDVTDNTGTSYGSKTVGPVGCCFKPKMPRKRQRLLLMDSERKSEDTRPRNVNYLLGEKLAEKGDILTSSRRRALVGLGTSERDF